MHMKKLIRFNFHDILSSIMISKINFDPLFDGKNNFDLVPGPGTLYQCWAKVNFSVQKAYLKLHQSNVTPMTLFRPKFENFPM